MSRPVHRAEPPVSRSSLASTRNNSASRENLAKEFSASLEKSGAGDRGSVSRESQFTGNQFGEPGVDGLQALSDEAIAELVNLPDDDLRSHTAGSSSGIELGNAPMFNEQMELSQPQLHNNSTEVAEASRGVVDTSVELLMAEFRRLDTQRGKRSWQFTVDGAGIEVAMDLQQSDDGAWLLRLNLPQGHSGFNEQEILEDLQERLRGMDQQIQLEVDVGVPS